MYAVPSNCCTSANCSSSRVCGAGSRRRPVGRLLAQLVQVAVQILRRHSPLLFQCVQALLAGRVLLGLVRGVAQHAHELLVQLVKHVVRVGAVGRAARRL